MLFRSFHYYHPETKGLDFASLMDDIKVCKTQYNSTKRVVDIDRLIPICIFVAVTNFLPAYMYIFLPRMRQMVHSFYFMLALIILLEWTPRRNNGERSPIRSRLDS